MDFLKAIPVYFFKEDSGNEPVRKWLSELSNKDRKIIGRDLRIVQLDWPIGSPLIKSLGNRLWELRSSLDGRISRIIFIFQDGAIVLLHGFVKKSQKIPLNELELARKRAKKIGGAS